MKPSKHIKVNIERKMILAKTHFLFPQGTQYLCSVKMVGHGCTESSKRLTTVTTVGEHT